MKTSSKGRKRTFDQPLYSSYDGLSGRRVPMPGERHRFRLLSPESRSRRFSRDLERVRDLFVRFAGLRLRLRRRLLILCKRDEIPF